MKMKKVTAMGMAVLMAATMIPAVPAMADDAGKVYYLNFKPEQDEDWQNLAKEYTEETGTEVTVVTAASGQYETTLQSEMAKSDAPTLFQVNGPVGLKNWKDYCYDLKDSDIYSQLTSDSYSLKDGDAVDGIAYVIESYGLIVNKTLLEKAGYTLDDIKSFDDLKKVADDIQSKKDDLGIKGAFTSAGMDGSSDWRFKTHLANLPIYYEYKEDGIDDTDAIKGTYLDNYKNVFDLYITDSTCDGSELSAKTADEALTNALIQMETTSDQIEYEVVDKGSAGFLGIARRDAVIKVRKKYTVEGSIREFLEKIFAAMELKVEILITQNEDDNTYNVELKGDDMGILIGKRGQTLDSLQYLTNLAVNKQSEEYIKVKIDTEDYRKRRKETLENLAKNIAYKVKRTKRPVSLEPMNPFERRVIHSALQNDKFVTTHSEGDEPYRHVVVTLKRDRDR